MIEILRNFLTFAQVLTIHKEKAYKYGRLTIGSNKKISGD
jgi:hypothetical protein